ncbi:hypothetical protein [Acidovorax sp.]|uniref:hypothetical protein n=1 Tax=Acidovorax sp. TaxID=1872122 RepID=UPI0025C1E462|nr:hypothetical protein [Acidovorax sp.]
MQEAMHAARLVAAQSALLALLVEQQGDQLEKVDGVSVTLAYDGETTGLDVIYTANGRPVSGEGA